jgi:hypothetical protein
MGEHRELKAIAPWAIIGRLTLGSLTSTWRVAGRLARGWVEGACGPLGKDRLEPSGRRWTTGGAQAVLDLRAVRLKGHGETSWPFHRHQHHQRLYGQSTSAPAWAEARALNLAA